MPLVIVALNPADLPNELHTANRVLSDERLDSAALSRAAVSHPERRAGRVLTLPWAE
jgi:hypothetical protein